MVNFRPAPTHGVQEIFETKIYLLFGDLCMFPFVFLSRTLKNVKTCLQVIVVVTLEPRSIGAVDLLNDILPR